MSDASTKNNSKLARWIRWGIYATSFIPLIIFSEFLSPFHFGKVIIFRSIIEILLVLYIWLLFSRAGQAYWPWRSLLTWVLLIFTVIFGLTALTGINSYQSFWGNLERMGGWFSFVHYFVFFVIAGAVLRKREDWIGLIKLSIFVSLLATFYGLLQKTGLDWVIGSGGRVKIFGTIGNPALFAGYIIINTFLALLMYFRPETGRRGRIFYGIVFLLNCSAVILAGVRGSVLGLLVGLLIFGFLSQTKKIRKLTAAFLVVALAMIALLYSLRDSAFVKNNHYLARYSDISLTTRTVQTRFWAWQAGIDGWNDSLKTVMVGYGPENFNYPFSFHFNPQFYSGPGSETLFDRAHNMFIEVLVTMGLLGLSAYIFIFMAAFRSLRKFDPSDRIWRIGLIALLTAYIIHSSFIFNTSADFIVFFAVLGLIDFFGRKSAASQLEKAGFYHPLVYALMPLLFIPLGWLIYTVNIKPAIANYTATRAIVAYRNGDDVTALEKFRQALAYDVPVKYEIRQRFGQYIVDRANQKAATQDPKIVAALKLAAENLEKSRRENPNDYLPTLFLTRVYIMLGKDDPQSPYNDQALATGLDTLRISPTMIRAYFEVAQAYLNKKDYQKAEEYFSRAYELNPAAPISQWYLGMSYIERGEVQKGLEIINNSGYDFRSEQNQLLRVIEANLKINDFKTVVNLYLDLVRLSPGQPQFYASLALAYAKVGDKENAIKAANAAVALDPSFKTEADAFIKSLK